MKNKDNGWTESYYISHARSHRVGNMKCSKCEEKIKSNNWFLIRNRANWKHRGNETDECYIYHRNCSSVTEIWDKHDIKLKANKIATKKREAKLIELANEIAKLGFTCDELF